MQQPQKEDRVPAPGNALFCCRLQDTARKMFPTVTGPQEMTGWHWGLPLIITTIVCVDCSLTVYQAVS